MRKSETPKIKNNDSMKQQMFRSPDIQPTIELISEALGEAYNAYERFVSEIEKHGIHLEWRYYKDGKAWLAKAIDRWTGARGGKKETTVFWLSIWDGFFKVSVYIPEKSREDVEHLPLGNEVKKMITDSKQMGSRLAFFPCVFELQSDEMFESVFTLLDFRKSIR